MNFILMLLVGLSSWAGEGGTSINGGGGGVAIAGQVYLLDFYENGIHNNPYIGTKTSPLAVNLVREHKREFDAVSDEALELIFTKINDVAAVDPVLAAFIEKALFSNHWNFSHDEIFKTEDTQGCVFKLQSVQLAIRQGNLVNINLTQFAQMDALNQAGLLIHEALQSLAPESPKDVCRHRRSVAALFTKSFLSADKEFWNATFKSYPTGFEVLQKYSKLNSLRSNNGYFYSRKGLSSPFWAGAPIIRLNEITRLADLTVKNPKPIDTLNWLLFPNVDINFVNGRTVLGANIYSTPSAKELCAQDNLFKTFEVKYWRTHLTPRYNKNGQALAHFDWSLKESVFTVWSKGSPYEPLAPCSADDLGFLKDFETWKKTTQYFQVN